MMVEHENLPANLTAQELSVRTGKQFSLVARGMAAVLANTQRAMTKNNDVIYRQAREVYNRLTDDGLGSWFGYKERELPLTEAFNSFQKLAAEGYGKAYYPLSTLYGGEQSINGDPVQAERFRKLAFDWLFANQLQNDPEIWNDLGKLYLYLASDSSKYYGNAGIALIWFLKAANMGDASAMWHISRMYEFGCRVSLPEGTNSLYWQIKAAKAGHEAAQHGLEQQHGHGDLKSKIGDEDVFDWYVWSAEQGHLWAQLFLAHAFRYGDLIEQDDEQAAHWYLQAATQGDGIAQYTLGRMHCSDDIMGIVENSNLNLEPNNKEALYWLYKAAKQDVWLAQWQLGHMFEIGCGVNENVDQASYWYLKAAEHDDCFYQGWLASMYKDGDGCFRQNLNEAAKWFRRAAENGDADAQYQLGQMYESEQGFTRDYREAARWFRLAADQGHSDAQAYLGGWCEFGIGGVTQDRTEAARLYRLAAEQGNSDAQQALKRLGIDWKK